MSTWIFDSRRINSIALLLVAASLAGCTNARLGSSTGGTTSKSTTIKVASQQVVIQGPAGFCVDRETSQIGGDTAFVLLGNCRVVAPSARAAEPKVKALLTASIAGAREGVASVSDSVGGMDRFFRSETGRAALSRESAAATVEVLETFENDRAFFLRARDTSPGIVPGAADDYWRSYFDLNGQIVSVSVIGFEQDPISAATGLDTVREFTHLIRESNGVASIPVSVAEAEPQSEPIHTAATTQPRRKANPVRTLWTLGLLRRLLGSNN